VLCLDGRTDDKGLAMTASFSNMVVAGQLIAHTFDFGGCEARVGKTIEAGKILLERAPDAAKELCGLDFHRAVFLGSGPHYGTAIESHLKLQELTAGRIMCGFDTFMGLRHGPQALIDGRTLVIAYISKDLYRRKYEGDLLKELREKKLGLRTAACGPALDDRTRSLADVSIDFDPGGKLGLDDEHAPPVSVILGQLLGLFKSVGMGLKPDSPSEAGVINRVVKGVKVYNPLEYRKTGRFEIIAGE
jgi:tagatose-6-phosphate ketose/aldose isomerase